MSPTERKLVEDAAVASNPGRTERDEALLGYIEALLRDASGQKHGVWRWRVGRQRPPRRGELEPYVAGRLTAILKEARATIETADLEKRMQPIELRLGMRK
jgi:hypothetical protein